MALPAPGIHNSSVCLRANTLRLHLSTILIFEWMQQKKSNPLLKINRPIVIFSVLVIYIFASFAWWTYLLISNNRYTLHQNKEIMEWRMMMNEDEITDVTEFPAYKKLESEYRQQVIMIIGEAFVFLVLLSLAIWQIWKSYRHELSLARQQRNFLLSITHELKSPLASIKLGLETMEQRQLDPDRQAQITHHAIADTNRLQNLVEDILLAARFEDRTFEVGNEAVNLSQLVERRIQQAIQSYGHRTIDKQLEQDLWMQGDRQLLSALISNLLENALKYSDDLAPVSVNLYRKNSNIWLQVEDQGVGVPDGEKDKIFQRFYRVGNEDTRLTKGTGIGLFIVKQVVDAFDGKIMVRDNEPCGSVFEVCFPILDNDKIMTARSRH